MSWGYGLAEAYYLISPLYDGSASGGPRMVGLLWCDDACHVCGGEGVVEGVGKRGAMHDVECPSCDGDGTPQRTSLPEVDGRSPPERYIQTDLVGEVWAIDGVPITDLHQMAPLEPPPSPSVDLHGPAPTNAFSLAAIHSPFQASLWDGPLPA